MRLKKYDRDNLLGYTFGVFPTLELLQHQAGCVREVLLNSAGERNTGVGQIRALCQAAGIPVTVDDRLVERLAPKENTYVIGVFEKYRPRLDPAANHLVLVNPADMGNVGTTLRTMVGFGFSNLALIRPAADIFDPRTIRASMGALFQVNFAYWESFEAYRAGFDHALYLFMTQGEINVRDVRFEPPFALVFGSESSGLPEGYGAFGRSVTIRQSAGIDSLNLSVAIGIGLYEAGK